MMPRFLLAAGLAVLMVVSGVTSYVYLGTRQSRVAVVPQKPPAATPKPQAFSPPGTLYLVQSGAIYSYSAGRFHALTPEENWMQPSAYPDGTGLIAVKRFGGHSDVYLLTRLGQVNLRLTDNQAAPRDRWDTGANAWSFYPRLSPDQHTFYMSYDGPKYAYNNYYDVDLAVWAVTVGQPVRSGRQWTNPNGYTGGDVQPIPLAAGGLIYTKYSYDDNENRVGQLWYTNRAGSSGGALTPMEASCAQPSVSPDGGSIAMICTHGKQLSNLVIGAWNGSSFTSFKEMSLGGMVAQPTWAPDGSGIAYLAPEVAAGPFQLWFLPKNAYNPPPPSPIPTPTPTPGGPHNGPLPIPTPAPLPPPPVIKPIQLTTGVGFDATSTMAWLP
jgi:Tol biopolymer transport system component